MEVIVNDTSFIDFSTHDMVHDLEVATSLGEYETKGIQFHAGLDLSHEGTPPGTNLHQALGTETAG